MTATLEPRRNGRGRAHAMPATRRLPASVPPEIFMAALETYLDFRRLDMSRLAAELGIGRATLYRRVRSRDHLLGEVLWFLTERVLDDALSATAHLRGAERVIAATNHFNRAVAAQKRFLQFLDQEPEAALRILTSKHGAVQSRLIASVEALLAEEEERGELTLSLDRAVLAYVIVRIGESFLYADVIADSEPDLDLAIQIIARLLNTEGATRFDA